MNGSPQQSSRHSSQQCPQEPSRRWEPVRTCVGCRARAAAAELLRVVVAPGADRTAAAVPIVPDPQRRMPGRGAHVHPNPSCVYLAQRRRAFGRALRVSGSLDASPVDEYVAQQHGDVQSDGTTAARSNEHEQAMKPQS